tara:strand:+ start:641 stop:808 length:168 start_codon:yes stop_codon:yes gene_type:complete
MSKQGGFFHFPKLVAPLFHSEPDDAPDGRIPKKVMMAKKKKKRIAKHSRRINRKR